MKPRRSGQIRNTTTGIEKYGFVLANLSRPDMRMPIAYGLFWPDPPPDRPAVGPVDLVKLGRLTFHLTGQPERNHGHHRKNPRRGGPIRILKCSPRNRHKER